MSDSQSTCQTICPKVALYAVLQRILYFVNDEKWGQWRKDQSLYQIQVLRYKPSLRVHIELVRFTIHK